MCLFFQNLRAACQKLKVVCEWCLNMGIANIAVIWHAAVPQVIYSQIMDPGHKGILGKAPLTAGTSCAYSYTLHPTRACESEVAQGVDSPGPRWDYHSRLLACPESRTWASPLSTKQLQYLLVLRWKFSGSCVFPGLRVRSVHGCHSYNAKKPAFD